MNIKQEEIEKIKKLIKKGFELELISFELEYPLEELKEIKSEMEKEKENRAYSYQEIIEQRQQEIYKAIDHIRQRYQKLYFNGGIEVLPEEKISSGQLEKVNKTIKLIKDYLQEMKGAPKVERRQKTKKILTEIKEILEYQITIEQGEELMYLLQSKELQNLKMDREDVIEKKVNNAKKAINRKFIEAVDNAQNYIIDIDKLKELVKKLSTEKESLNQMYLDVVRTRINNKITKIKKENLMEKIRNDIPTSIQKIIKDLANGELDVSKAQAIIKQEAKKKVSNKNITKFTLTEEQEEKQMLSKIRIILRDRYDLFHIINPEKTIQQLQQLCEGDIREALIIVSQNLINSKNLEEAKKICDKFNSKELSLEIKGIKIQIRNQEISEIVLNLINKQYTLEEERGYFELIEKAIKREKLNIETIKLGKSQDGVKNISLADIWTDTKQKFITR